MPYTIKLGGYTSADCHTEVNVQSYEDAVIHLHAYARKDKPEKAIADIGDYRSWLSNENLEKVDLNKSPLRPHVSKLITEENRFDAACALADNLFIPDIEIQPISEDKCMIISAAMQYEAPCKSENISRIVKELIDEYRELIAAEELSAPAYAAD